MIYIIHFETPLNHARHYVGYCAEGTLDHVCNVIVPARARASCMPLNLLGLTSLSP